MDDYLQSVLARLEQEYSFMADAFDPPVMVTQGSASWFRYRKQSDSLLCFLKGVKLVSTLNAALVLLRHGYVQEVGALGRMADDFFNEIMFFIQTADGPAPTRDHERFFTEFFQEEFEDPDDPLGSSKNRDNVPRRKIFAAFGQLAKEHLNPSDAQNTLTTIHRTFSGYVHGAYPHIMELFGNQPSRFHMTGMLGTTRISEWRQQFVIYLYRAIMASVFVSRKLGLQNVEQNILALLVEFETKLDIRPNETAEEIIRKVKKSRPTSY